MPILAERDLLPYLDLAYQGFGDGIVEDAYAVRALAAARGRDGKPLRFFVANSFSKSMSLYGERCGALSVVCADAGRSGQRARPAQVHGPPQLLEPADPRRPDRRRGARASPSCARTWEAELGGHARAHPGDARRRCTTCSSRKLPGPRLLVLPDPARHVQLHRPVAAAGRSPARGVRRLPGALGPDVRRRPQPRQRRGDGGGDGGGARRAERRARIRPLAGAPKRRCAKIARPVATLAKRSPRTTRAAAKARCSRSPSMSRPVEPPVR